MTILETVSHRPHWSSCLSLAVAPTDSLQPVSRTEPEPLSPLDTAAVLRRGRIATVSFAAGGQRPRCARVPFAFTGTSIVLPATRALSSLLADEAETYVECEVSEIEGLAHWCYVWARGFVRGLQPTGCQADRDDWRACVEALRRSMPHLSSAEELRFGNFGVLLMTEFALAGVVVPFEPLPEMQ